MAIIPPSKKTNQMGSGFTNLQRVLQANKSNSLGSTVAGGVQKAGQAAQGAINQAGNTFKTNVDNEKSRLAAEQARANRVLGDVNAATDEDVNAFEGIRGGQTKGETSIKNADEIAEKGREAQSLGQATGNEGGRFGLLQRFVGGNQRYTGGQQRLDNMLLGQTGQADLRKARVSTSGLQDKALNTAFSAEQQGQELKNRAQGLATDTISKLGGQITDYDKAMQDKATAAAANRKSYYDTALKNLTERGEVDQATLDALGLTEGTRLYDTDFSQLLKQSDLQATKQNVQSADDFKKFQALSRLSGNSMTGDASKALAELNSEGQVGEFDKSGPFQTSSQVKDAIAARQSTYDSNVNPINSRINDLVSATGSAPIGMANTARGAKAGIAEWGLDTSVVDRLNNGGEVNQEDLDRLSNIARQLGIGNMSADQLINGAGGELGQFWYAVRDKAYNQGKIKSLQDSMNFNRVLKLLNPSST